MNKFREVVGGILCFPFLLATLILADLSWLFYVLHLKKLGDLWLHFWDQGLIWVLRFFFGMHFVVKGRENLPSTDQKICYIANHQSMLDIPAIVSLRRYPGIIGKVELKKVPLLNILMYLMKCVYIDRGSMKESMKAIIKGTEQLKAGQPMMIFPEGTRSKTYEIAEFKAGSFRMAKKADAVICPICIQNTTLVSIHKSVVGNQGISEMCCFLLLGWVKILSSEGRKR